MVGRRRRKLDRRITFDSRGSIPRSYDFPQSSTASLPSRIENIFAHQMEPNGSKKSSRVRNPTFFCDFERKRAREGKTDARRVAELLKASAHKFYFAWQKIPTSGYTKPSLQLSENRRSYASSPA